MDEVLFRSSQKLENFQVQLSLVAAHSKDIFHQYSQQGKSALLQAWNSSHSVQIKQHFKDFLAYLAELGDKVYDKIWLQVDLQQLYYNLVKVFWQKWTKRDACFLAAGFISGGLVGVCVAFSMRRQKTQMRYMQAIQCMNYLGIESAQVVQNAPSPYECSPNDVLITVKAASINYVDAKICSGYGRTYRHILQKLYNRNYSNQLPLTLGRDCTGIITDVGSNVRRLEIGDEVWLTVPFWAEGTLSQIYLTNELRCGRKPKNIGFEGAASLPYAGCVALDALKRLEINEMNAQYKKILIIGACTPVGCVLVQILKHWNANITASCFKRAIPVAKALGVGDIIPFPDLTSDNNNDKLDNNDVRIHFTSDGMNWYKKELEVRDGFHAIIITRDCGLTEEDFASFALGTSPIEIISTLPKKLKSDRCWFMGRKILEKFIYFKYYIERLLSISSDYDEAHMCYMSLDELYDLVENGHLQTVVDKVYHPEDIEIALNHIQSFDSIGSTVITFR